MEYKFINTQEDLENLKSKWEKLELNSNNQNPSSSFKWIYNWWLIFKDINNNRYGHDKSLAIITISDNNEIVFIAPFIKLYRKPGPLKISFIEFLGQQWGATTISFLRDKSFSISLKNILTFLNKNISYDIFHIRQIPFEDDREYSISLKPFSGCPYIKISDYNCFDDYKSKIYSRKFKQTIRSSYNKMERNNIKTTILLDQLTDNNFKEIIRLSANKIEEKRTSIYQEKEKLDFYKRIFNEFQSKVLFIKTKNESSVAYLINIFYQNSEYGIDLSFDRNFKQYNPGILSLEQSIQHSFENSISTFSMGPGMEDYKQKFCSNIQFIGRYTIKGNTLLSGIYYPLFSILLKLNNKRKEKTEEKK